MTITQVVGFPFWLTYKVLPWVLSPVITPVLFVKEYTTDKADWMKENGSVPAIIITIIISFIVSMIIAATLAEGGHPILALYYSTTPMTHPFVWALKGCWRQWIVVHEKLISGE